MAYMDPINMRKHLQQSWGRLHKGFKKAGPETQAKVPLLCRKLYLKPGENAAKNFILSRDERDLRLLVRYSVLVEELLA